MKTYFLHTTLHHLEMTIIKHHLHATIIIFESQFNYCINICINISKKNLKNLVIYVMHATRYSAVSMELKCGKKMWNIQWTAIGDSYACDWYAKIKMKKKATGSNTETVSMLDYTLEQSVW